MSCSRIATVHTQINIILFGCWQYLLWNWLLHRVLKGKTVQLPINVGLLGWSPPTRSNYLALAGSTSAVHCFVDLRNWTITWFKALVTVFLCNYCAVPLTDTAHIFTVCWSHCVISFAHWTFEKKIGNNLRSCYSFIHTYTYIWYKVLISFPIWFTT